jgi:hypothetical protein
LGIAIGCVGKRSERRPIERLEQLGAALAEPAHDAVVEVGNTFLDGAIELGEGEELPMANARQHPSLDDLNRDLDLGLVARLAHAGRQHDEAVVVGQVLIGSVDARLVARWLGHAGFQIVADYRFRYATERRERADVRSDPISEAL